MSTDGHDFLGDRYYLRGLGTTSMLFCHEACSTVVVRLELDGLSRREAGRNHGFVRRRSNWSFLLVHQFLDPSYASMSEALVD